MSKKMSLPAGTYCARVPLAMIRVTGDDAARFLHDVSSSAVLAIKDKTFVRSSFLRHTGHIESLCLIYRSGSTFTVILSKATAGSLLKFLQMRILRRKVTLEADGRDVIALASSEGNGYVVAPYGTAEAGESTVMRLSDANGFTRYLLIGQDAPEQTALRGAFAADREFFACLEIAAREPLALFESPGRFHANQLALTENGVITVAKGCYPGRLGVVSEKNLPVIRAASIASDTPIRSGSLTGQDGTEQAGILGCAFNESDKRVWCLAEYMTDTPLYLGKQEVIWADF